MRSMSLRSKHNLDKIDLSSQVNYLFLVFVLTKDFFFSVLKANALNTANILLLLLSVAVAMTANRNYLRLLSVKPILFWSLWVVYAFLAWAIIGIRSGGKPLNFILPSFVYPIITMCIVCYEGNKDLRRTTLVVLVALSAYVIAGMLFQDHSAASSAWEDERGGHQMGNKLPLKACILTFMACLAFIKGWIDKRWFIALSLFSLVTILYVATRKAFAGWMIVMGASLLSRFRLNKPRDWIRVLVLLLAALFVYNYIMAHTYMGVRMEGTVEQGMERNETDVEALNYLGDRAMQYAWAWEEFLKHPLTGIGIHNYQAVTGSLFRLHTEYMVQLCECGLIGVTLYLLFVFGLLNTLSMSRGRTDKRLLFVCLGGILCVLFINFTSWTYEGCHYFAMYGIILAVCNPVAAKAPAPRYSIIDSYWAQLPVPRLRLVFALRHLVFVFTERVGLCVRYTVKGVSRVVRGVGVAIVGFAGWCWRIPLGAYRAVARLVRGVGAAIVGFAGWCWRIPLDAYKAVARLVRGVGTAIDGLGNGIVRTVAGAYGSVHRFVRSIGSGIVGFGAGCRRVVTDAYGAVSRFVQNIGGGIVGLGLFLRKTVTGAYGSVRRLVRNIGGGIVAVGTTILRAKGVWYALASVAALAVLISLPHSGLEPESQVAEVTSETTQVPDDTYEDELDYSTVVEDNTGMLRCAVPESWMKGFDLVISWRCDAPDVCFQIRPVGTKKWTTMHYNDTGKSSDIIPYTLQKEFLASGETLEWRLFARFPDNTTVVKTGNVTLVN